MRDVVENFQRNVRHSDVVEREGEDDKRAEGAPVNAECSMCGPLGAPNDMPWLKMDVRRRVDR